MSVDIHLTAALATIFTAALAVDSLWLELHRDHEPILRVVWTVLDRALNARLIVAFMSAGAVSIGLHQVYEPLLLIFPGVLGLVLTLPQLVAGTDRGEREAEE